MNVYHTIWIDEVPHSLGLHEFYCMFKTGEYVKNNEQMSEDNQYFQPVLKDAKPYYIQAHVPHCELAFA